MLNDDVVRMEWCGFSNDSLVFFFSLFFERAWSCCMWY